MMVFREMEPAVVPRKDPPRFLVRVGNQRQFLLFNDAVSMVRHGCEICGDVMDNGIKRSITKEELHAISFTVSGIEAGK